MAWTMTSFQTTETNDSPAVFSRLTENIGSREVFRATETFLADTVIVSDIHLGSEVSRSRDLLEILRQGVFRQLSLLDF